MLGASSMSSLPTLYLPANSSARPSTIGARTLQGPHHVAVKSTSTGLSDLRTSASKFASVSSMMFLPAMCASPSSPMQPKKSRSGNLASIGPDHLVRRQSGGRQRSFVRLFRVLDRLVDGAGQRVDVG